MVLLVGRTLKSFDVSQHSLSFGTSAGRLQVNPTFSHSIGQHVASSHSSYAHGSVESLFAAARLPPHFPAASNTDIAEAQVTSQHPLIFWRTPLTLLTLEAWQAPLASTTPQGDWLDLGVDPDGHVRLLPKKAVPQVDWQHSPLDTIRLK